MLWHEDFRRNLSNYGYNDAPSEQDLYTGDQQELFLSPEPEWLYTASTAAGERVVDFSDNHEKAKEIFLQVLEEMKAKQELRRVVWKRHPYYWRAKTSVGINLRPGLLNGRPEQPRPVCLNDDVVHGVAVGRTGSGKSVLLNNLLVTLMDEYAPWELSLYIVDMKKVEFGAFMSKGQEGVHIKACAATSEVRYVLSMLRQLERTMQMRQTFFTAVGYKKIAEFRRDNPTLVLPRILLVVDEFQQLLLNAVGKEQDEILRLITSITRLGRATGFHLLFASQEMAGTGMSSLLSNFKLRMALPCDAPVSSEILGNSAASELTRGYVYVNCAGGDESKNMKFQVPYVDKGKNGDGPEVKPENRYLQGHLQFVRHRADKAGFLSGHTQRYYQEDLQYDISVLEKTVLPRLKDSRRMQLGGKFLEAFALGNGVLYSDATVDLESICIEKGKSHNIFVAAPDGEDLAYLQKLFLDNLRTSPNLDPEVGSGIHLDLFPFDPVLTSLYDIPADSELRDSGITVQQHDEDELPEFICDLIMRRVLFKYLSAAQLPDAASFLSRASTEYALMLDNCQPFEQEKMNDLYEVKAVRLVARNFLTQMRELPDDDVDALSRWLSVRDVEPSDVDEKIGVDLYSVSAALEELQNMSFDAELDLDDLFTFVDSKEEPQIPAPIEKEPPKEEPQKTVEDMNPRAVKLAQHAVTQLKWMLEHYIRCVNGESIQRQFPLQVVMMSNVNLSSLLSASSMRRDIRVLQENLLPMGPTHQTLFIYFLSEADNYTLRPAFNYFFVCGNREKDYAFCRMNYTNKAPGSIVVDCRISSKNVERSFKKFRWTPAKPEAETLNLAGISNLYGDETTEKTMDSLYDDTDEHFVPAEQPAVKKKQESSNFFDFL